MSGGGGMSSNAITALAQNEIKIELRAEKNQRIYRNIFVQVPVPPSCPGCYKPSEVNQEIVDFALSELQSGDQGKCSSGVSRVENFQSQVTLEPAWSPLIGRG